MFLTFLGRIVVVGVAWRLEIAVGTPGFLIPHVLLGARRMDDSVDSYSQSESPPPPSLPRLTLLLPPLKDVKKASKKSKSKSKSKQPFAYSEYPDASTSKAPRPVKLKPLKEVLGRLIVQLKKKDDYAFFLKPVNPAQVPGYSDLIKRPMDLGTMTVKVQRGRYRSLEDFADDFRLVTGNAKIFNPPGSIYHTEADKLEVWGLDQISKASSTVIQYETDWNIEIEKDDFDDEAEDYSMAVDAAAADTEERSRSPSASLPGHPALRRGPRGPYNKASKENPGTTAEKIDAEGRLPGSKDGLGAFPPGSDWARTMLALKLKGKRYKTKKERMRIEKDGPPFLPDGSLDYYEVEDPFTFLSALVPDPLTRPQLAPIYPPAPPQTYPPPIATPRDTPTTPAPPGQSYPLPILVPSSHPPPPTTTTTTKHWTIIRPGAQRRVKDDGSLAVDDPDEHTREAHALDFGSFAVLAGELAAEMRRRGAPLPEGLEDADALLKGTVRNSLEVPPTEGADGGVDVSAGVVPPVFDPKEYWSTKHALEAEGYIRDVVYGGVDGLAYVRSLAEFVGTPPLDVGARAEDEEDDDVDMDATPSLPLRTTLPSWVAQNIVGPLTEGRHALLQRTARELIAPTPSTSAKAEDEDEDEKPISSDDDKLPALVSAALHVRPRAAAALTALLQIHAHKLDMTALIRSPAELEQSEEEWAGKGLGLSATAQGPAEMNVVLDYVAGVICRLQAERDGGPAIMVKKEEAVDGGRGRERGRERGVDTIARLPVDLIDEALRQSVPTLPAAGVGANPQP
ncbi:Bromodomain-containing 7 [Mycena venus]|uniref:Bromodomain-containing 7 n=1 Tax=Mycena venus TaxID=2733690 RepID=A0A8H6X3I9_9AGAR|nr:Bromodomain-containing 7 [Mycena venus]